jgi:hypothetical protein
MIIQSSPKHHFLLLTREQPVPADYLTRHTRVVWKKSR